MIGWGVDERAKRGEGLAPDTKARENTASKTFGAQSRTSKSIKDNPRYGFSKHIAGKDIHDS